MLKCALCGEIMASSKENDEHRQKMHNVTYECSNDSCKSVGRFKTWGSLRNHKSSVHGTVLGGCQRCYCSTTFMFRSYTNGILMTPEFCKRSREEAERIRQAEVRALRRKRGNTRLKRQTTTQRKGKNREMKSRDLKKRDSGPSRDSGAKISIPGPSDTSESTKKGSKSLTDSNERESSGEKTKCDLISVKPSVISKPNGPNPPESEKCSSEPKKKDGDQKNTQSIQSTTAATISKANENGNLNSPKPKVASTVLWPTTAGHHSPPRYTFDCPTELSVKRVRRSSSISLASVSSVVRNVCGASQLTERMMEVQVRLDRGVVQKFCRSRSPSYVREVMGSGSNLVAKEPMPVSNESVGVAKRSKGRPRKTDSHCSDSSDNNNVHRVVTTAGQKKCYRMAGFGNFNGDVSSDQIDCSDSVIPVRKSIRIVCKESLEEASKSN